MSWGYRVVIIIGTFVIGILTMVYISMQQDIDMIDDQYYDKELKYQQVIDAKRNLQEFNDSVLVTQENGQITIKIPAGAATQIQNGRIEFLRPSDKTKDKIVTLSQGSPGWASLPEAELTRGLYRLRAQWQSAGKEFYDERDVFIK